MRRTASCLLSVAALLLSSAARAELLTVSPEKANVRDGPGLEHEVLWVADQYTVLRVLDWSGEWANVRDFSGVEGWVHRTLVWGDAEPREDE